MANEKLACNQICRWNDPSDGCIKPTHATCPMANTKDAVSSGAVDQIRWERDVAIKQLEEHGIPFCGIAPDVVKVVRCKDCIWFSKTGYDEENAHEDNLDLHMGHCSVFRTGTQACRFCSYGERRD